MCTHGPTVGLNRGTEEVIAPAAERGHHHSDVLVAKPLAVASVLNGLPYSLLNACNDEGHSRTTSRQGTCTTLCDDAKREVCSINVTYSTVQERRSRATARRSQTVLHRRSCQYALWEWSRAWYAQCTGF